jgi:peptidoglycan/xylan/chitin deacetylase (PgdA/CDA1 family)
MNARLKAMFSHASVTRALTATGPARTVILMYHDLRTDDDFPNWLRVSAADFEAHLTRLARIGDFIAPDQLFTPANGRRLRFLITFDDGYRNNFDLAAPLLRKHNAPALFFISTEHMQAQETFWPDLVVTPIQALRLESLDLSAFDLGICRFRPPGSIERWDDIQSLLVALKALGNIQHPTVAAVLQHLRDEYADTLNEHLPRFRPLNAAELKSMAADPLFHIGSHAHHHDILTYQDDQNVTESLSLSQSILADITGREITHLAYPNGDHDDRIMGLAQKAGYDHAYAVRQGVTNERTPRLSLPRLGIGGMGPRSLPFFQLNRLLAKDVLG